MPVFEEYREWFKWDATMPTVEVGGYTFAYDKLDVGLHIYVQGVVHRHLGKFFCYLPISASSGVGKIRAAIRRQLKERE